MRSVRAQSVAAPPRRTLRAKLVLRKGRELVVEVAPSESIAWDAGARVIVRLADGTEVSATVDAVRTTRPMRLFFGLRARVSLHLGIDTSLAVTGIVLPALDLELEGDGR
jgi:hypothetical protein